MRVVEALSALELEAFSGADDAHARHAGADAGHEVGYVDAEGLRAVVHEGEAEVGFARFPGDVIFGGQIRHPRHILGASAEKGAQLLYARGDLFHFFVHFLFPFIGKRLFFPSAIENQKRP